MLVLPADFLTHRAIKDKGLSLQQAADHTRMFQYWWDKTHPGQRDAFIESNWIHCGQIAAGSSFPPRTYAPRLADIPCRPEGIGWVAAAIITTARRARGPRAAWSRATSIASHLLQRFPQGDEVYASGFAHELAHTHQGNGTSFRMELDADKASNAALTLLADGLFAPKAVEETIKAGTYARAIAGFIDAAPCYLFAIHLAGHEDVSEKENVESIYGLRLRAYAKFVKLSLPADPKEVQQMVRYWLDRTDPTEKYSALLEVGIGKNAAWGKYNHIDLCTPELDKIIRTEKLDELSERNAKLILEGVLYFRESVKKLLPERPFWTASSSKNASSREGLTP